MSYKDHGTTTAPQRDTSSILPKIRGYHRLAFTDGGSAFEFQQIPEIHCFLIPSRTRVIVKSGTRIVNGILFLERERTQVIEESGITREMRGKRLAEWRAWLEEQLDIEQRKRKKASDGLGTGEDDVAAKRRRIEGPGEKEELRGEGKSVIPQPSQAIDIQDLGLDFDLDQDFDNVGEEFDATQAQIQTQEGQPITTKPIQAQEAADIHNNSFTKIPDAGLFEDEDDGLLLDQTEGWTQPSGIKNCQMDGTGRKVGSDIVDLTRGEVGLWEKDWDVTSVSQEENAIDLTGSKAPPAPSVPHSIGLDPQPQCEDRFPLSHQSDLSRFSDAEISRLEELENHDRSYLTHTPDITPMRVVITFIEGQYSAMWVHTYPDPPEVECEAKLLRLPTPPELIADALGLDIQSLPTIGEEGLSQMRCERHWVYEGLRLLFWAKWEVVIVDGDLLLGIERCKKVPVQRPSRE